MTDTSRLPLVSALAKAIAGPNWDRLRNNPNSQDEYRSDAFAVIRALEADGYAIVKINPPRTRAPIVIEDDPL